MTLEVVGEVVGEHVLLSARDGETGRSESAQQVRVGGRLGVNLAVRVSGRTGVVVGADASALSPPVRVVVEDVVVGREPTARLGGWLGLRLSF